MVPVGIFSIVKNILDALHCRQVKVVYIKLEFFSQSDLDCSTGHRTNLEVMKGRLAFHRLIINTVI